MANAATLAPTARAAEVARRASTQLRVDLGQRPADRRAELHLLRLELGYEVGALSVGPSSSALSCSSGVSPSPRRAATARASGPSGGDTGGVDHEELFFDANGSHPLMIGRPLRSGRVDRRTPAIGSTARP